MKALYFDGSLSLAEVPVPEPRADEVLIKVSCSSICNTDVEILKGYMGFRGIPGHEFAGRVVSAGSRLAGRLVVGEINCPCGNCHLCLTGRGKHCTQRTVLGIDRHDGVFAEYIVLPEKNLHEIPAGLSPFKAVFAEPLAAALEIAEQVHLKPSEEVFIFGAGKLGLLVSMVLGLNGCRYMTFDPNPVRVEKATGMGLHAAVLDTLVSSAKADVCIDCTGNPEGITIAMNHLYPMGKLVLKTTVAVPGNIDLNRMVIDELTITGSRCGPFAPALNLLARGLVDPEPLVSRVFPFADILTAFDHAAKPDTCKVLIDHG